MMVWFSRLYLFLFLFYSPFYLLSSLPTSSPTSPFCHHDESSALPQFKNSLSISKLYCGDASPPCQTMSWKNGTNCCRWDGVTCGDITGHVIGLNLTAAGLNGIIQSNSSLFRLAHLKSLVLSHNDFNRSQISSEFGRFESMMHLDLSYSNFFGQVAPEISYLSKLHTINLSSNDDLRLEASTLKRIVENTKNLTELSLSGLDMSSIDLSTNQFLGEIPNLIGRLKSLHGLNFSHNELSGSIPPSLRNLSNLEWLDLSSNQLVGVIPEQLEDLTSLEFLKLSHNKLVGPIPHGKQFNTFENDSYIGNSGLCGFPLSKTCNNEQEQPPSPTNVQQAEDDGFEWKFVWMGYISGLVIGLSIGYIVLSCGKFDHWFSQCAVRRMWYKLNARLRGG